MPAVSFVVAAALLAAPEPMAAAPPDTSRVVRTLEAFDVRGAALNEPLSTESVHLMSRDAFRTWPVDRVAALISLKPGVVASGEDLHVRGGRAGEIETFIGGIRLNDPLRGRAIELPLFAIESAELLSGGMDADFGGGMAGAVSLRTREPDARPAASLQWQRGAGDRAYDRVAAAIGGPLGHSGLGLSAAADVTLDDTHLPSLRSFGRRDVLGASIGWRADNRLLGQVKVMGGSASTRFSLEHLATRRVTHPYDPMWSVNGFTTPCADVDCFQGPAVSPDPLPGYAPYRASDHKTVTDDRRHVSILALERRGARHRARIEIGHAAARTLTSLGGSDDESYLTPARAPVFGVPDSPTSEPFFVYRGDEPFFRRAKSEAWTLAGAWNSVTPRGGSVKAGAGMTYESVAMRELDLSTRGFGLDSLRTYRAWAPGAWLYGHGRWVFEGLAANAGLRAEYFTAGPQADRQSLGAEPRGIWSFSPRLGIAYPISAEDVFSLGYARVQQAPDRDFLYDSRLNITNRQPLGNPALEPATLVTYQAALKHLIGRFWSFQASVFYRDFFGVVQAHNIRPPTMAARLIYDDTGSGSASGFELSALRVAGDRSRLELHYTWMDAQGTFSREEGVPFGSRQGSRPESIGQHPLDWDRRHAFALSAQWRPGAASIAWTTRVGSPLPWTPAARRALSADLAATNSRRLGWEESSAIALRWTPRIARSRLTVGIDVLNLFDSRTQLSATADGYPNPFINTIYDDYGAYRTETGQGGGAYWNDANGDGMPGWRPVHDPRLIAAPRSARLIVATTW
jgi:outer membrane receptor protein involved in Fe transport